MKQLHYVFQITDRTGKVIAFEAGATMPVKRAYLGMSIGILCNCVTPEQAETIASTSRILHNLNAIGSRVKCMTNDMVFDNSRAAARFANVAPSTMSQHLNHPHKYPTCGGYVFNKI